MAFLLLPGKLAPVVGLSLHNATADNDLRAVYGGLQIACGVLLWAASHRQVWLRVGLYAQLALFGGLAVGRFVSWAVVGLPDDLGLALHAAEGIAIIAGVLCLRKLPA